MLTNTHTHKGTDRLTLPSTLSPCFAELCWWSIVLSTVCMKHNGLNSASCTCILIVPSKIVFRDFAFKPQTKEMMEVGAHQTMGVDLYVTSERVIILDTQVRHLIWKEKKNHRPTRMSHCWQPGKVHVLKRSPGRLRVRLLYSWTKLVWVFINSRRIAVVFLIIF